MNELEKKIDQKKIDEFGYGHYNDAFTDGCNFIQELNLPVLFAEWVQDNCYKTYSSDGCIYSLEKDGMRFTTTQIYNYWINNEYGK